MNHLPNSVIGYNVDAIYSVCLNALLSAFAPGLGFTSGCGLSHIIFSAVHAGVGVTQQPVHGYHFT